MSYEYPLVFEKAGFKVKLAIYILNRVAPRIMNLSAPSSYRIALAFTWYRFLCGKPRLYGAKCPEIDGDPNKWGKDELRKIAETLIDYATSLLVAALHS